ncbi:SNF2 family N-terminal domain-containing protein [Zopfochytrium polystomum]|nr:SNF2 family N-terminal domain-containing protein [Zopfochytrium polystomum]
MQLPQQPQQPHGHQNGQTLLDANIQAPPPAPETSLIALVVQAAADLRSNGQEDSPQYQRLIRVLRHFQNPTRKRKAEDERVTASSKHLLSAQVLAFKLLNSNQPVPERLRNDLLGIPEVETPPDSSDPLQVLKQRELAIRNHVQNRLTTLRKVHGAISNEPIKYGETSPKLRALIEMKGLSLLERQKRLREEVLKNSRRFTTLDTAVDRSQYRRVRTFAPREARETEIFEQHQRTEREKKEHQRLVDYLQSIIANKQELLLFNRMQQSRMQKNWLCEKEEQKRAQKVAQDRLNALKANDEEAYLKLLGQAKNTRIHHILSKTSMYLETLSAAVLTQQNSVSMDSTLPEEELANVPKANEANKDYYTVAHRVQETVTEQSSLLVGGKLKDYQIKGLQWMISLYNNRLNGILADEMGLGKTIQTISLITYLMEKKRQPGPFLVIIPLATMTNWVMEFEKWAPSVVKIVFNGPPNVRKRLAYEIRQGNFNVLITTYEYIIKEKAILSKIKWIYMIIDEGHRMKNANSKLSVTLMQFYQSRFRLILTGTPLQNNLPELWALLNFILPKIFNSVKSFDEWFSSPFTGGQGSVELNEEERLLMIQGLHKVLRPFLLRRLKKDVESELPDKVETVVKCPMSALQKKITEWVKLRRVIGPFDQMKVSSGARALNNLVMQFRKICNHPFIFPEIEELVNPEGSTVNDSIYRASGKFELLDRVIPKFLRTGHRILMFFQMTQIMDIIEDFFRFRGYKFLRLDGHVKGEDRTFMLNSFNAKNSEYDIFILSTRAGGLGLNLQTADTVIIFDSDWNPHQDLQAQDRAHRIGQTKEVRILRLITTNSIEEHILAKAQQKLDLDGKVIQAGKFDQKTSEKEREELLRLLFDNEKDENEDADDDNPELTDEQLNEVISRNPDELELFTRMDREREEAEIIRYGGVPPPRLMTDKELPDVYKLDIARMKPEEADELLSAKPRERKQVNYADVLTEDQFLEAVDNGNLDEVVQKKLAMRQKRQETRTAKDAARKRLEEIDDGVAESVDADDGNGEEPEVDDEAGDSDDYEETGRKRKVAKGRNGGKKGAKRGRGGKGASRGRSAGAKGGRAVQEAADVPEAVDPPKKRRKKEPQVSEDHLRMYAVIEAGLNAIRECSVTLDDGTIRQRCEEFEDLPSKRRYKDYYKMIARPMSLAMITTNVDTRRYNSVDEFQVDVETMFKNARQYNEEDSEIVRDAAVMEQVFEAAITKAMAEGPGGEGGDESGDGEVPTTARPKISIILRPPPVEEAAVDPDP